MLTIRCPAITTQDLQTRNPTNMVHLKEILLFWVCYSTIVFITLYMLRRLWSSVGWLHNLRVHKVQVNVVWYRLQYSDLNAKWRFPINFDFLVSETTIIVLAVSSAVTVIALIILLYSQCCKRYGRHSTLNIVVAFDFFSVRLVWLIMPIPTRRRDHGSVGSTKRGSRMAALCRFTEQYTKQGRNKYQF